MKVIEHTITIDAPADKVWRVLIDTGQYQHWNPFITHVEGHLAAGNHLNVTIHPGKRTMTFQPTVLAAKEAELIRWRGRLGVRGVFDGDHELRLEHLDNGTTRFTQRETFSGVLVPFLRGVLDDTARGFEAMNVALRDRATQQTQDSTETRPV